MPHLCVQENRGAGDYLSCPWVCHFRGERLERVPKGTWKTACERVGFKGEAVSRSSPNRGSEYGG